ncbi:MAG: ArsR family transcriptional regulator [Desulfobulbaceae bacterium]|nr:ArsR family transcriptional regulator [Desulfobulbaceae bacterium]
MSDAVRISATEIRARVKSGEAMLVCAYDSDDKFKAHHLEGAVSLAEFRTLVPTLAKDKELVFFCA